MKSTMENISILFDGWEETLIWSCLQGCMGTVFADATEFPNMAQIHIGDFCFIAGDAKSPKAPEFVAMISEKHEESFVLIAPQDEAWGKLIEEIHGDKVEKTIRYATKKNVIGFDKEKLEGYVKNLDSQYQLVEIDEDLFEFTQTESWSQDFCSQFVNYKEYEKYGMGFVILHEGKPICGASSYTYYNEGIEIEIGTLPKFRRRGIATICAAKLILKCMERKLYPSWDAANKESLSLAQKLGYHFAYEYNTYIMK